MIAALALALATATPGQPVAVEQRRLAAPEARQGVAAGRRSVYAVDNSTVARYDKATGQRLAVWQGDPKRFRHLNSCARHDKALVCAASNYPDLPMANMAIWLDAESLKLIEVRDLPADQGSLTWLDWHKGGWWAGFANYDGRGGAPGRDHRETVIVRFTRGFAPLQTYRFPPAVLARFAPYSTSGGAWGRDGLLYVTGHDRPELYALRLSPGSAVFDHVATIATPTGGQAIDWDPAAPARLWSIDRPTRALVVSTVPKVPQR